MKYKAILAVAVGTAFLVGCGGGGDSAVTSLTASPSGSTGPLAKYAGAWLESACTGNNRETYTLSVSNNGNTLAVIDKLEYFENADCSGAVVATGTYPAPLLTMQYIETVSGASIKYVSGTSGTSSVDRVTASSNAGNNITFSGSGVTSSVINAGTTTARIVYPNGSTNVTVNASPETSIQAGLLLQNGIFSTLTPIGGATTSFQEQDRFVALGAGGGPTSLPVITTGYNYAQHDGNYSCVKSGTTTAITFSAKFSASNLVITPNGVLAGIEPYTIKSKVGFINSLPYYSDNIELTSKAETYFFFNNNLTVINSPASDVPDLLFQRPTSTINCNKIA